MERILAASSSSIQSVFPSAEAIVGRKFEKFSRSKCQGMYSCRSSSHQCDSRLFVKIAVQPWLAVHIGNITNPD